MVNLALLAPLSPTSDGRARSGACEISCELEREVMRRVVRITSHIPFLVSMLLTIPADASARQSPAIMPSVPFPTTWCGVVAKPDVELPPPELPCNFELDDDCESDDSGAAAAGFNRTCAPGEIQPIAPEKKASIPCCTAGSSLEQGSVPNMSIITLWIQDFHSVSAGVCRCRRSETASRDRALSKLLASDGFLEPARMKSPLTTSLFGIDLESKL
mmetsp:Transcript_9242/g.13160  ORF Transcript_9242/g.13160 Transcript_9242/m.13160 type:complete len:216 (-) Transcript_9242:499-1146(-)